jgi:hypothetical protein
LNWISSLFPAPQVGQGTAEVFAVLLKAVLILGAIMIVVAIVSIAFSAIRKAGVASHDARFRPKRGSGELAPRERLQGLLEEALRAGHIDEAARLRWKLHLMRKALPSSITPGETDGYGRFYPLMFGGASGEPALKQFNELDLSLRASEGRPEGHPGGHG